MSDGWIITGIIVGIIVRITAPLIGLGMWLDSASCGSKARSMALESSWGPLQECMVKVDGNFMPLKNYTVVKLRPTP